MVLGNHTEYLTRHPFHCGWSEVRMIGTDGSQGYIFLRWFQAHRVFMGEAHHILPGLLRCKGKGAARCVLPCISFLSFGGTWAGLSMVTRSSQEAPSPALPSIQDDLPELSEVIGPLTPLFPVAPGATAPHLLGLCCCWSALGHSIGPGGTSNPCR